MAPGMREHVPREAVASAPPRIGITLGDPAGIGPEIISAALASGKLPEAEYRVIGESAGDSLGNPSAAGARAAFAAKKHKKEIEQRDA